MFVVFIAVYNRSEEIKLHLRRNKMLTLNEEVLFFKNKREQKMNFVYNKDSCNCRTAQNESLHEKYRTEL